MWQGEEAEAAGIFMRIEEEVIALTARPNATIPKIKALYQCGGFAPQVSLTSLRDLAPFRQIPTGLFLCSCQSGRQGTDIVSKQGRVGKAVGNECLRLSKWLMLF